MKKEFQLPEIEVISFESEEILAEEKSWSGGNNMGWEEV